VFKVKQNSDQKRKPDTINLRIELDPATNANLEQWAAKAERSKRQMARVIIKRQVNRWLENRSKGHA
jgi:hypothetical protein